MKILIIGATSTIGKHVIAALQKDHEVIKLRQVQKILISRKTYNQSSQ